MWYGSMVQIEKGDIGAEYDSVCEEWEEKILNPTGYHFWSYGVFDRMVQPHADRAGAILDLGCGTGSWLAQQGKGRLLVGLDISLGMAREAKKASQAIVVGDAERLPFKGDVFDLVLSRGDSITQAYDVLEAFGEVHRVLASGGRLCFEMGWGCKPFGGLILEEGEVVYRRDFILCDKVMIQALRKYHLPEDLRKKAEEELGGEPFHRTEWSEKLIAQAKRVVETHILVGSEPNVRNALKMSGLTLEGVLGTGVLGWQVSTKQLSEELIETITKCSDVAIDVAALLSSYVDLARCHRATVIASKQPVT